MFQFKQFTVDQTNCAMKINTDGVLLGAMAEADNFRNILDIGTGTGVIALMLAQKYEAAVVDAVEIDAEAAHTAKRNFESSVFQSRLKIHSVSIFDYFREYPEKKYDLIVSNPPFFLNSLKSPAEKKALAKHTDAEFFKKLIHNSAVHLNSEGGFWLVLPSALTETVISFAKNESLFPCKKITIRSYAKSAPHRVIINLRFSKLTSQPEDFIIYETPGKYSDEYKALLKPYFLAF